MNKLLQLHAFRQALYDNLGPARDALFELMDATLTTPAATSFAELSLSPLFRRRWSSLYEALEDGRPASEALVPLTLEAVPAALLQRPILIGDHTAWPRLAAPTLKGRTIEHQPTRQQRLSQGEAITVGLGYATLALWAGQVQEAPRLEVPLEAPLEGRATSWALPLLHERILPSRSPLLTAADQLGRLCRMRQDRQAARPLSLWDTEYGCGRFLRLTADVACDKLLRLKANRCLYGVPPPYPGHGPPFKHGALFKFKDETTWPEPDERIALTDARHGRVCLMRWCGLHFQQSPEIAMEVVLIERLDGTDTRRKPKRMWLAYVGETRLALERLWRLYLLRFSVEHLYRFMKQRLYWTLPRVSTAEQADRWSALMGPMMTELYLARQVVADTPLPWQQPLAAERVTPGRVCAGFAAVRAVIGTPTRVPKERGKSPGWPPGQPRKPRDRYPVVRKKKKAACRH